MTKTTQSKPKNSALPAKITDLKRFIPTYQHRYGKQGLTLSTRATGEVVALHIYKEGEGLVRSTRFYTPRSGDKALKAEEASDIFNERLKKWGVYHA